MQKIKISIIVGLFLISFNLIAQDSIPSRVIDKTSFGIGAGFDFGGIGTNLLVYPTENVGLFGGMGYAIAGVGFNVGAKFRLISKKHNADPYALVMYGYNAAIAVKNASNYNKLFYGPTFGFGFDLRSNRIKRSYWSLALLIPIRSSEVNDYMDDLKNNHGIEFKNELPPIGISIGYRFIIN